MRAESFSTYDEALEWLHSLLRFGVKPGLDRMQWILEQLQHPERTLAFVHVAGTNGKGSVVTYLAHMLREAGYNTGEFTSPYIADFRERIRYNGEWIPQEDLLTLVNELKPLVERCEQETQYGAPTEFEVITLLAILYFARVVRPAVVLWETGLGGRLDSTNIVFPLVSVITSIGLDHTEVLGPTIADIAKEKAGIIKPGVPVVVGDLQPEAFDVISQVAHSKKASIYRSGEQFQAETLEEQLGKKQIRYASIFRRSEATYQLQMNGVHQTANAAVALMTLDLLKEYFSFLVEEEEIARGLQKTSWLGRLETFVHTPVILLDGAHNVEGMTALVQSVEQLLPSTKRVHLLMAALSDKPLPQMVEKWHSLGERLATVFVTSFDFPRAAPMDSLTEIWRLSGLEPGRISPVPDWRSFLRAWIENKAMHEDDWLIVCGSLYFVSEVRSTLSIIVEGAGE
ncbi:bifunctional folylpolyglutamate synthase/dihydrofolate synthase [Brevibacillus migulae]|uniref:bifunctional folylpolyglutamate synthase/dihydrofolate synthase n=1 Tax=Brevibacillus migulae TaxID=1644114 RepID=UPI00106E82E3|nr:folylpolyglutamate synthase/dihydrofolate synthase family protein [Brevibacillus migulae]